MKCCNCGAELAEDTKFCSYCGIKIEKNASEPLHSQEAVNPNGVPYKKPINEQTCNNATAEASHVDNKKEKLSGLWNGLDLFCKTVTVYLIIVTVLLIISICTGKTLAIFISLLQLSGGIVALLIHKGVIRSNENLKWLKYLVLVFAILLTVPNLKSYSWGQHNDSPAKKPEQKYTDYQTPDNDDYEAPAVIKSAYTPYSSDNCVGKDYSSVESDFTAAGFEHVRVEKVEDLQSSAVEEVNTVVSVAIGNKAEFTSGQEFAKDEEVVILYHVFSKCSVTVHVDFIPNIIFSKYDVNLLVNGIDEGALEHGKDKDFTFLLDPGEYTFAFQNAESSSVKGEVSLNVFCDVDIAYKISCYSDKVSVEEIYIDNLIELAPDEVKLDVSSSEYKYKNYKDVTAALEALGFINIKYKVLYDIVFGWTADGEVDSVSIAGDLDFIRGNVFSNDAEIFITYHMPEEDDPIKIKMPKDSDDYNGMNYLDAEQTFKDLGFSNIELEKRSTESVNYTDGEVYSVKIDSLSFDKDKAFKPDDKVTIKYYAVVEPIAEVSSPVFYSTNDYETAKKGNTGVFSYKSSSISYDIYWIIDFDEGFVYYFTDRNNESFCDRLKIESGDLNDKVTITYHDGDDVWSCKLHFKYVNHPETLIMVDQNGFESEYSTTTLTNALSLMDSKIIKDY